MKILAYKILLLNWLCLIVISQAQGQKAREQQVAITTSYGKILIKLYNETPKHRDNFISLVKNGFYDSLMFHRIIPDFMLQGGDPKSKYATKDSVLGNGELGYTIPPEINHQLFHKRGALGAARNNNPTKASHGSQFYIVQGRKFTNEELSQIQNQVNFGLKQELFQQMTKSDSVNARVNDFMRRGDQEGMQTYLQGLQPALDKAFEPIQLQFSAEQLGVYITTGGAPHLDLNYTVFGEVVSGMEVIDIIAALPRDKNDRPLTDIRTTMRLVP